MNNVRGDPGFQLEESLTSMKALCPCCPSPCMPSECSLPMLPEVWNVRTKPRKTERKVPCSYWLTSSTIARRFLWLCLRWFKESCVRALNSRDSQGSTKCSPVLSVNHHQPHMLTDQAMKLFLRLHLFFPPLRLQIMKYWISTLLKD